MSQNHDLLKEEMILHDLEYVAGAVTIIWREECYSNALGTSAASPTDAVNITTGGHAWWRPPWFCL